MRAEPFHELDPFVPYLTSAANACQREQDCALQDGHRGACYPIGILYEPVRSQLAAARVRPEEPSR